MSYIPPQANAFKARYPEFDAVDDARVAVFISEASRFVDETWVEADYALAIMHLAAHFLSMEGEPGVSLGIASMDPVNANRPIKRRAVGDVAVEFEDTAAASPSDSTTDSSLRLSSTVYGQRYRFLLKLNMPAAQVI